MKLLIVLYEHVQESIKIKAPFYKQKFQQVDFI